MRAAKGSDLTLVSPTFVGGTDFETPTATASTPVCTVTLTDGTVLAAPTVTAGSGTGVYYAALTAAVHLSVLDCLTVVWTGTVGTAVQSYTDQVDVVASHWLTNAEMRALPDLDDKSKYPLTLLASIRDEYTTLIERECGVRYTRGFSRESLFGNGLQSIPLRQLRPKTILAVTVDGTVISPSSFDVTDSGRLVYISGMFPKTSTGARNVVVSYEHGHNIPPLKLKRELAKCIRSEALLQRSSVPENALSQTFDGTVIRYSTGDRAAGRPTGIMSLDPVLVEYTERIPGIA